MLLRTVYGLQKQGIPSDQCSWGGGLGGVPKRGQPDSPYSVDNGPSLPLEDTSWLLGHSLGEQQPSVSFPDGGQI